jgi:hypothetical protein
MAPLTDTYCAANGDLPAAVGDINATVLGLAPAVAGIQGYLGLSMASQIGLFEAVNQYQRHAMTAAATAAAGVLSLRSKPRGAPASAPPPAPPPTPAQQVTAAHQEAAAAHQQAEQSVAATEH